MAAEDSGTGPDPRVADEKTAERVTRLVRELASDAPHLAKIALESLVRDHRPELAGTANSAGRAGSQSGRVSELTAIGKLVPGGATRLRRILNLTHGNMDGAERVSTLHNMRFVFFDDDTRVLFATAYDGDWDTYINDFATKIPGLMDLLFQNVEGWPGISSPDVKDFIVNLQITADGWFVANPNVSVVDVRRYQQMEQKLHQFLDALSPQQAQALEEPSRKALRELNDVLSVPEGVDY